MTQGTYGQFCPVAMAAEVLCTRWTVVVLRELVAGSTRFNDLRRGVPRMSPGLLSQRLKQMEHAGVISRVKVKGEPGVFEYHLTRPAASCNRSSRAWACGGSVGSRPRRRCTTWTRSC